MSDSLLDPEFTARLPVLAQTNPAPLAIGDVEGRRQAHRTSLEELTRLFEGKVPTQPNVSHAVYYAPPLSDGHRVEVHHYFLKKPGTLGTPTQPGTDSALPLPLAPAIFHMHGGGMIMGSVAESRAMLEGYVAETKVPFFAAAYRLAPEHPHPTPVGDCYAALEWLREHAAEVGVDRARIGVMGESGGGGLAACVALMARDRDRDRDRQMYPPIAKQILVYPMLDDRTAVAHIQEIDRLGIWTAADNVTAWGALLGEHRASDKVSCYAAAARADSLGGLPSTYLDVGSLDIFRDEIMVYAQRLVSARVETEFHLYPGVPHAFEMAQGLRLTELAHLNRMRAIQSF